MHSAFIGYNEHDTGQSVEKSYTIANKGAPPPFQTELGTKGKCKIMLLANADYFAYLHMVSQYSWSL